MGYRGVAEEDVPTLQTVIQENKKDERYHFYDPSNFTDLIDTQDKYLNIVSLWEDELKAIVHAYCGGETQEFLRMGILTENVGVICSALNEAWQNSPDNGYIHGIRGWDILCSLCEGIEEE